LAEWERRFPNAETMRFEDGGHYILEDAGDEIIPRICEFLEAEESEINHETHETHEKKTKENRS
jgi:hypothetical protein